MTLCLWTLDVVILFIARIVDSFVSLFCSMFSQGMKS